jgi:RND family efflux transporter MFP subunit
VARAESVDGFTEPYRTINAASSESGIVSKVLVHEGEAVRAGQPLVVLDDDIYLSLLEIAKQQMEATGRLKAAQAELDLFNTRLHKLQELQAVGQANQQEVDRAKADAEMSDGRLLAIKEELMLRKLEYKKIQQQLERRTVTAPVDGTITAIKKNRGEFVSPVDPVVVTLVQLNPIRATFLMPRPQAARLRSGQRVAVRFPDSGQSAPGIVELVSELTDAESGTVTVRIRIDNEQGKYRSGERCVLASDP